MHCAGKLKLFVMSGGEFGIRKATKRVWIGGSSDFKKSGFEQIASRQFAQARMKQVKLADKPGSVVDSHSSRRFVT